MRLSRVVVIVATAVAALVLVAPARAAPAVATPTVAAALNAPPENPVLVIHVDKSTQTMTVTVDGVQRDVWPVSTGREGYNTPSGDFKPFRMDIDHYSVEWDDAPMPHSIFFTMHGAAIHGTLEERHLGQAVSHGCVRLSRKNAAILWRLVKHAKMANTEVLVTGKIPATPAVALTEPAPTKKTVRKARTPRTVEREPGYARSYDEPQPPRYGYARSYDEPQPPRYGYARSYNEAQPPRYDYDYGRPAPPDAPPYPGNNQSFPLLLFGR